MPTIGIIGSGNLGANTAFFLAEKDVADVILFDVQEGLSEGKALDMMEASSIRAYQTRLSGTNSVKDILKTEIIILAAGAVRKPGMQRKDLFAENAPVIGEIAGALSGYKGAVIVATEPVDYLTTLFARKSGIPASRVMGLGGCLDSARLRYLIARELALSYENVSATVIGEHSGQMLPLTAYCRVSGIPVDTLISKERLAALFDELKKSGDLILDLAKRTSAYYGPSAAASDLAEAIIRNTGRIMSVSHVLSGQYGIDGVALSLPAIIGGNGIRKTLTPVLQDKEKRALTASAEAIRSQVG